MIWDKIDRAITALYLSMGRFKGRLSKNRLPGKSDYHVDSLTIK